ncbi:hypothetical protein HYALB_00009331 [Hymenoscyphus albidus]|uniref:Uncharacterized protein n=1 Tax=Hymenoscyphus albidus TaxID=595503 RepID=A0A9N9LRZ0_9HELO|nr:hypothetical protein HYALB_00009331 [Hymenoscyphus albidus]
MPAIAAVDLLHATGFLALNNDSALSVNGTTTANNTSPLQVVCAWPVSGQYGPGSRVLYYLLIAACVFARKAEWLRSACLAAALLFPTVAALHAIVLASVHVDGAVDMDVYGAFQLCSIGILAAPVTVKLSRTYFFDPGRNIIFVWTILILAGLLGLIVEFFRITPTPCMFDNNNDTFSTHASNFAYGNESCGMRCTVQDGPDSPLRRGSVNNIYVIPAPDKLSFDTVTILAAACCIPAILSLVSMWNKILEINWKSRYGNRNTELFDEPIEGTNGATPNSMKRINEVARMFVSTIEIPLFGAAVLTIMILGELNFFSAQVNYQTEPIASIGQWAPIVGSGLAVLGSLYILWATDGEEEKQRIMRMNEAEMQQATGPRSTSSNSDLPATPNSELLHPEELLPPSRLTRLATPASTSSGWRTDAGNRKKIAKTLNKIGTYIGTAAPDRFDDSEFKRGLSANFPEIPGEPNRNPGLNRIREAYNPERDADGLATRSHSRAASPAPSQRTVRGNSSIDEPRPEGVERGRTPVQRRRATLEVPLASPIHQSHTRNSPSWNSIPSTITVENADCPSSPTIVVSTEPDDVELS